MRKYFVLSLLLGTMLFTSCRVFQKVTYLDDMQVNREYPVTTTSNPKIQSDDKLKIIVRSKSPELAAPFNAGTGSYTMNMQSGVSISSGSTNTIKESGYTVDENGKIDFPVLGELQVDGLTISELENMIKNMLIDKQYIKDPIVTAEFLNFRIIMIGGSTTNGILSFDDSKVTLLEAIAKCNLNSDSKLETVAVIRTENGMRKMYHINLHSVALFSSPVYYLRQNDIIYIEQKHGDLNKGFTNFWSLASIGFGITSLVVSIIALSK